MIIKISGVLILGICLIVLSINSKSDADKCSDKLKTTNTGVLVIGIIMVVLSIFLFILKFNSIGRDIKTKFSF